MKIRLGRRFHDIQAEDFASGLQKAEDWGFRSLQLAPTKSLGFTKGCLTPGYAKEMRRLLDQYHLDVAVLGSYFDLSNDDFDLVSNYRDHILLAAWSGISVIGTETGFIERNDPNYDKAFAGVITNLEQIIPVAERFGIVVAIEPVYGHTICDSESMLHLINHFRSENLRVIYDPANLLHPDRETDRENQWAEAVEKLSDYFVCVHLKDYDIVDGRKKYYGATMAGRMDYSHLLRLSEVKPHLDFILESANDSDIPTIIEQLKNKGFDL